MVLGIGLWLDRTFANAARRCTLVQSVFLVATDGENYPDLATTARENGTIDNQIEGGGNGGAT